jgi:hypothetical protein
MYRISRLLVGALILLTVPSLATASNLPLNPSSMTISIGDLPPVSLSNNPASIAVSSGAGTFTELPGVFGPTTVGLSASLFTGVSLISGLTLAGVGNGTQFCTQPGPPLNCLGGVTGVGLVNVLQLFNLTIPLSVVGTHATTFVSAGGIFITVVGQGWTAGTATVTWTTFTPSTMINSTTAQGSDNRTAGHGGSLVLVTGFKAITNVAGTIPGFVTQSLNFAPEPVELLLLGVGLAGFGLYAGARRLRK